MNSNAISAKNHAVGHLFCWTLRKNALIIGIASVLSLLMRPGLLLLTYFSDINRYAYSTVSDGVSSYTSAVSYSSPIIFGQILTALIACVLIILLFSLNFRYLHSKNESDLFHALPLRRTQLLLTRFAATVTGAVIPIVVSTVGQMAVIPLLHSDQVTLIGTLYTTLLQLVLIFAASAMTLLFCVMVGNTFDLIVSLLVVNGGWMAVHAIVMRILSNFLIGFVSTDTGRFALSPFARLLFPFDYSIVLNSIPLSERILDVPSSFLAYWLIFSAVMLTLAIFLAKRRKNEAAGQPFAYTGMRYISMGVVSIIAGYLLGGIFSSYDTRLPGFYVFFIVGAFLGAVIYGAIATRGFKTVMKSLITGGVCSALFIAVVLTAWFDLFGYSGFVPKADSIESVTVDMTVWLVDGYENGYCRLQDAENIDAAIDIHEAIVSNPQMLYENAINSQSPYYVDPCEYIISDSGGSITLHYKSKSGMTVDRRYALIFSEPIWNELLKLVTSDEYIEQTDPLLKFEANGGKPENLTELEIQAYTEYTAPMYLTTQDNPQIIEQIYEAYKQDLATITSENKSNEELYWICFSTSQPYSDKYNSLSLTITRAHKNVLRVLGWTDYDVQTDPLLSFEANGGNLTSVDQLCFIIFTDEKDYPTDVLTAERPELMEKICDAYREDLREKNFRFGDRTLCNIQFYTLQGEWKFDLNITDGHENTIALLQAEGFDIDPNAPIITEYEASDKVMSDLNDNSGKAGVMSYNFETEQWESDSSAPIPADENDPIFSDTTTSR